MNLSPRFSSVLIIKDLPAKEHQAVAEAIRQQRIHDSSGFTTLDDGTIMICTDYPIAQSRANLHYFQSLFGQFCSYYKLISEQTSKNLLAYLPHALQKAAQDNSEFMTVTALPRNSNSDKE
jgi:hypothetical protein